MVAEMTPGSNHTLLISPTVTCTPSERLSSEVADSSEDKRRILMVAEMTPGSNHTLLISPTETKRTCSVLFRLKPRSEQSCNILRRRPMDQKHPKSHRFRTCLMFHAKDQARMEQRVPSVDSLTEGTEGSLKELVLRWFTETQAPLILHNGTFPIWLQGFITRKDAEATLRDKELGCFLLRLSDKVIGYILSYKGRDRCRHFVINQSKSGRFIVSGDTEIHDTLSDLIAHYKTSPIEPFGEYLTSSCYEASTKELYDIIQVNPKEKAAVSIRAVKNVWDQRSDRVLEQPPMLPPKSSGTLEEKSQGGTLKSGSLDDHSSAQARALYAHLEKHRAIEIPTPQPSCLDNLLGGPPGRAKWSIPHSQTCQMENIGRGSPAPGPDIVYSELNLLDCRSKSLPLLDNSSDEQHSYRLTASSFTPPRLSPQPPRQATCHAQALDQRETSSRPTSSHSLDYLCNSPVYHLAGRPGIQLPTEDTGSLTRFIQGNDSMYAEVLSEPIPSCFPLENTYEQIPKHGLRGEAANPVTNNTYESLEELKSKHTPSSLGIKNDKWRWFFPEVRRK